MLFNPVYFIAESYRAAILFHQWYFIDHWKLALYNVMIVLIFFVLGSILHKNIEITLLISYKNIVRQKTYNSRPTMYCWSTFYFMDNGL